VYPALVVRQVLADEASAVLWVGGEGGMEEDLVKRAGLPYAAIPAAGVHGVGLFALPGNLAHLARGVIASRDILYDFQPDVLLFTGGFVGVPMAVAGRGIPSLVYVPDIEPGLALKFLARFASVVALTTEKSRRYFAPTTRTEITGYPLRPELSGWQRAPARAHLGLDPQRFTLLVTGGSKGAQTINRPVLAALPQLLHDMQILHITGQGDFAEAEKAKAGLPAELAACYFPHAYLHDMGAALAAADLAVSRAGASTLGEYPLFGLPAILVPYPFAWRYQQVNAYHLVDLGAALYLENKQLADQIVPTVQQLRGDPQRLESMRQAMRALARPDAAERLANLLRELASREPKA
jgi:UDP-N-acetylglucosamine--N-acetylmuramyl-(pentapeptide) pyrophosphoryl-undecaprenol N-acetylglucosamine transferase